MKTKRSGDVVIRFQICIFDILNTATPLSSGGASLL